MIRLGQPARNGILLTVVVVNLTMMQIRALASLFCLLACQTSRADLTLRHSLEVKFGALLPPEAIEMVKKQMASRFPSEVITRVKGDKVYSKSVLMTSITDCGTDQITLLNADAKRYATVPMADYPGKLMQGQQAMSPAIEKTFQDLNSTCKCERPGAEECCRAFGRTRLRPSFLWKYPVRRRPPPGSN
jgi:hypothetical protein